MSGIQARFTVPLGAFRLDVDLALPAQGVSAVFGRSGAGKTTLLRCLAGLERAPGGRLTVQGEAWQDDARGVFLPPHARPVGYVFQEASLFPHLSVRRNLEYGWRRIAPAQRHVTFEHTVAWLGIEPLLQRAPQHLSGGERQRVAIARALLTSPRLLLMDEPLTALDAPSKAEILPYLERLHDELAIPVIYVSHAPDEVARLADHLLLLERGQVHAQGPLLEMLARADLAAIFGDDAGVVYDATVGAHDAEYHLVRLDIPGGSVWTRDGHAAVGQRVRVRILARDVSVSLTPTHDTSILNSLPAVVMDISHDTHPAQMLVHLAINDAPLLARLTRRSVDHLQLCPGRTVWAQIKAVAVVR